MGRYVRLSTDPPACVLHGQRKLVKQAPLPVSARYHRLPPYIKVCSQDLILSCSSLTTEILQWWVIKNGDDQARQATLHRGDLIPGFFDLSPVDALELPLSFVSF
jgi:hypothetical protein